MKIAVFDSGVGGLASLARLERLGVADELIYFADLENLPFGQKSAKQLEIIINEDMKKLFNMNADFIVIACNTACSVLEHNSDSRLIKISDFTKQVIAAAPLKSLLLCTKATLTSKMYDLPASGYAQSASELVMSAQNANFKAAQEQINAIKSQYENLDTVIAGCTHYGLLKPEFTSCDLSLLDPVDLLERHFSNLAQGKKSVLRFLNSSMQEFYKEHQCRL